MSKKANALPAEPAMKPMDGGPDDYEAKDAMNTLMKGHEIRADKALMGRVKQHAGRHFAAAEGLQAELASSPAEEQSEDLKPPKAPDAPKSVKSIRQVKDAYAKKFGSKSGI